MFISIHINPNSNTNPNLNLKPVFKSQNGILNFDNYKIYYVLNNETHSATTTQIVNEQN